ncbi:MAG: hypothetical protein ACO3QC_10890 [Phycisphaerales bacterium]
MIEDARDHSPASNADRAELAALERRLGAEIGRLRREARTARMLAGIACGALALGLVAMTNPDVARVIQTKRLEIVDDEGRVTMVATSNAQGARLDLWNATGANVARLGSNDTGGDFIVWNGNGQTAFSAYAQKTGGRAEIGSSAGKVAAIVEAGPSGGRMTLSNAAGSPVVGAGAFEAGGAVRIGDRDNKDAAVLQATSSGGSLSIEGATGSTFARLRAGYAGGVSDPAAKAGGHRGSASATEAEAVVVALSAAGSARLDAPSASASVDVSTSKGERVASLEKSDAGGLFVARTPNDKVLVSAGASSAGAAGGVLQVFNGEQNPVFAAAANSEGAGRLALGTSAGVATLVAESGKVDGGSLSLVQGGKRALAVLSTPRGGLLTISGADGTPLVVAGRADDASGGAIVVRSTAGKDLVRVGTDDKGGGNVLLFNKDATERKAVAGPR